MQYELLFPILCIIGLGLYIIRMMWLHNNEIVDIKRRAKIELDRAKDALDLAQADARHHKRLSDMLQQRLAEHVALICDVGLEPGLPEPTLRRMSDKFDNGAGKPLPFPKLFDAGNQAFAVKNGHGEVVHKGGFAEKKGA